MKNTPQVPKNSRDPSAISSLFSESYGNGRIFTIAEKTVDFHRCVVYVLFVYYTLISRLDTSDVHDGLFLF